MNTLFSRFGTLSIRPFSSLTKQQGVEKILKISLLSRRVGLIRIKDQTDFDSLLARASVVGIVPEEFTNIEDRSSRLGKYDESEEVKVVTKFEEIDEDVVYEGASLRFEGMDVNIVEKPEE